MIRPLLVFFLVGCSPRQLIDQTKRGLQSPTLQLDENNFRDALLAYERAMQAAHLINLPSFRVPGRQGSNVSFKEACTVHPEAIGEIDLATAEAPEGCTQSGTLRWSHFCKDAGRRMVWTWTYEKVRTQCGDAVNDYDGDVAIEMGTPIEGGLAQTWVIALGDLRSATYSYERGGKTVATAIVVGGERSAALMWADVAGDVSRDLRCFYGRDKLGGFFGSYIADELLAMYVPEIGDKRAHYRLQSPAESVLSPGCDTTTSFDICGFPYACN